MPLNKTLRWFADVGNDPDLAVAQLLRLRRQLPLLYGLLLINSLAVAITSHGQAPTWLTISVPVALLLATAMRAAYWLRARGRPLPGPAEARRMLRQVTWLSGLVSFVYTCWALRLSPYGSGFEQAHVMFYITFTVIGCIFCLVALPQSAVLVTLMVAVPFVLSCFLRGDMAFVTIGINLVLVLGVLLQVLFNSFNSFRNQIAARAALAQQHAELGRLNCENHVLARTDSLTQLPNRRQFYADLETLGTSPHPFAVGVLDLDRFKPVNDSFGHQVGDMLLKQLAQRLQSTSAGLRVYRLGGDEFGLLAALDPDEARAAGERLCQSLDTPFQVADLRITIGGSVGIAFSGEGHGADALFDRADYALYHAKRVQGGGLCIFTPELEREIRSDRAIEAALQTAVLDREIHIRLQPIVDTASGRIDAVEVLARWHSPQLGSVPPNVFIPVAERSFMIHHITLAVLRQGIAAARRLPDTVALSFNISACDLNSAGTVRSIVQLLGGSGVDPRRFWIEVTETAVMRNTAAAVEALNAIRAIGAQVALDDFGTGYSSLSNLHLLPLDKVKIDRSFINDLSAPHSRSIVDAVIALCGRLNLACVAEGVETPEQAQLLRDLCCDQAQGFLFSPPVDLRTLMERVLPAQARNAA